MKKTKTTTYNRVLHIDIETYCELDLTKVGVYAYASHPSFEILLFAYAYDDSPVTVVDMFSEKIPDSVLNDLYDSTVLKVAHNATFELNCLGEYLLFALDVSQWSCTMVMALQCGLPAALAQVGSVLNLKQQKMQAGTMLINYFSKPCKPTRTNGQRTRNLPKHDMEKWEVFKEYCGVDVEVEQAIYNALITRPQQPSIEKTIWMIDQQINDNGIKIDIDLVTAAIDMDSEITYKNKEELIQLTGKSNPKSSTQFKQYLKEQGLVFNSFTKKDLAKLLEETTDPTLRKALLLKQSLSKTSIAKYEAMSRSVCFDGRIRGLYQYYGGNRTGRWAGRLVQMQNLPQNHLEELDMTRELVINKDIDTLNFLYDSVPDTLSQLIRTAFVAKEGTRFIVADYSAIEARVIAWVAEENWRLDVFKNKGDIYCASASQMFKVPVEKHGVNGHLRQKGKIAELALGYGGGVGALKQMGALDMGIEEKDLQPLVDMWRNSNKRIKDLWYKVNSTVIEVIDNGHKQRLPKGINTYMYKKDLIIELPSKRKLFYVDARVEAGDKGTRITYAGLNQQTKKWERVDTFGGKLVENIIQAIARDCLAEAIIKIFNKGWSIVGHVHDEVIIEAIQNISIEDVCNIMSEPIAWAPGLLLNAEGYETPYYKKD